MKWEIRDCFDVWGNEKDGWEVNDTASAGKFEIPEEIINDDKRLLEFLVAHTRLQTTDRRRLEVNGDYGCIEVRERKSKRPLYWLMMVEDGEYMRLHNLNRGKEN